MRKVVFQATDRGVYQQFSRGECAIRKSPAIVPIVAALGVAVAVGA